jgi:hypothetical protein
MPRGEARYIVLEPRTRRNSSDSHGEGERGCGFRLVSIEARLLALACLRSRAKESGRRGESGRIRGNKKETRARKKRAGGARTIVLRGFIWINRGARSITR